MSMIADHLNSAPHTRDRMVSRRHLASIQEFADNANVKDALRYHQEGDAFHADRHARAAGLISDGETMADYMKRGTP